MTDETSPDSPDGAHDGERIAKVLARAGICSRRDAEKMIAARRIAVNGSVLTGPAVNVGPDDVVTVDGAPLKSPEPARLWRYHKAPGIMTTHKDPQGRPTVFDRLPREMPRVISVGRLDLNSEGLLLLTNDGDLARALEHPSRGWMRRYRVRVHGVVSEKKLESVANGVTIEGVQYGPIHCELERQQGSNAWIVVSIAEGKNREVRRVMEHLGYTVNRLIRVSYGPFVLGRLPRGEVDEVLGKVMRDHLGGLGDAVPPELRRAKVSTEKWAKSKPKTVKPGEKARERALAKGEGFKKGESTSKYAPPPEATDAKTADGKPGDRKPAERKPVEDNPRFRNRTEERPFWEKNDARKPGEGRPARDRSDDKPRGSRPSDGKPAARKPGEGRAAPDRSDDKPRGSRPTGGKPATRKPGEGRPARDRSDDAPRDRKPSEGRPAGNKPAAGGKAVDRRKHGPSSGPRKPSTRRPKDDR